MEKFGPPFCLSHYALLRIGLDATPEEVEDAYQARMRERPTSRLGIALRSIFSGETQEALDEARQTLLDPQARATYHSAIAVDQWFWLPPG